MGLAGGIVRKVFSKSPCSSAGGSRGHTEKGAADHRRRWSSLRLYLCGEEMNVTAEEEDDDEDGDTAVSVKSFETTCCPEQAHVVVPLADRLTSDAVDNDNPAGEPEEDRSSVHGGGEHRHIHVVARVPACGDEEEEEEEGAAAATLIQSAFRGFMARRQLQELKTTRQDQQEMGGAAQDQEEPRTSPTWGGASVATSVLVQVGESLSLGNLRLSEEDSASVQQQRSGQQRSSRAPPPAAAFRVKEEWDDSTVSSNVSRMRIQSRIEATTRRERALAYAFSQQLRTCSGGGGGGTKKRSSAQAEQGEEFNFNSVGWSWLERWMATRQAAEPQPAADDCMSRNADTGSATAGRRVVVVRRRSNDLAVEEKESCGSNDVVSVVSFDGSSSLGGAAARSGLSCHNKPTTGGKSRLKGGGRSLPRRKQVAASDHCFQARSHKVSKKAHHREEQAPAPHKDRLEAAGAGGFDFDDACQPPTDY